MDKRMSYMLLAFTLAISMLLVLYAPRQLSVNQGFSVTAASGSSDDIQNAVDQVIASGGGVVYIPAGVFNFTIPPDKIGWNNYPTGVKVHTSVPIQIIGAGSDKTVLKVVEYPTGAGKYSMFAIDSGFNVSVRVSGIKFVGKPDNETANAVGIAIRDVKDFRIDNCVFEDFDSAGISTRKQRANAVHRGVIDHNVFDNPYKEDMSNPVWGYGIIVVAYYGIYDTIWKPIDEYLGKYEDNVVYIEDSAGRF